MNYIKQLQFEQVLEKWGWSDYAYILVKDDLEYDICMPSAFTITEAQLRTLQNYDFKRMYIRPLGDETLLALHFMFNE